MDQPHHAHSASRTYTVIITCLLVVHFHVGIINFHVDAAKILAIPMPFASHIYPLVPINTHLQKKYNHSITFVVPKIMVYNPLLKSIGSDVIVATKIEEFDYSSFADDMLKRALKGEFPWLDMVRMFVHICEKFLSDEELMDNLKGRNFDILLLKDTVASNCMIHIAYKLSLPFMFYGNTYEPDRSGIPHNPTFIPDKPLSDFTDSMNFIQRVKNTIFYHYKSIVPVLQIDPDLSTKYIPEKPYISRRDLQAQVQFNLIDVDVLLDYPRPTMPNTVFVGGLNTSPAEPLPPDLDDFMDAAVDGAVIVLFGSFVKSIPTEVSETLFAAMKRFRTLSFVIRFGSEKVKDENIYKLPWIPQNDLLGHRNTQAFVTHCGNSGQFEALYHGVPMIGVPIFGDQFYNAERMKSKGYGLYQTIHSLDIDTLYDLIYEVVYNESYKIQISKASRIFHSRPETPSERAAFWIDHVIKYGGGYMQSKGMLLPWYIYFGLDVHIFLLLFIFTWILLFIVACTQCVKSCKSHIFKAQKIKRS